jgi:hypothetical protein
MPYNPVGVDQFVSRLRAGQYEKASNALRAIGKTTMSDAEKKKCRDAINSHFGAKAPAAAKGKAKAVKKAPRKQMAAEAPKRRGRPPKNATAAAAAPAPKAPKAPKAAPVKTKATRAPRKPKAETRSVPAPTNLEVQGERINYLATSIEAMKRAKDLNAGIDLGPGPQLAAEALSAIIKQIHADIRSVDGSGSATDQETVDRLKVAASTVAEGQPSGFTGN